MSNGNVELQEGFKQVCVWPACSLQKSSPEEFTALMRKEFDTRVQFLEEIMTKADLDVSGNPVLNTGGRSDLFFAVHSKDIVNFALPRLEVGIRWIEDVLAKGNYASPIYPNRVFGYISNDLLGE